MTKPVVYTAICGGVDDLQKVTKYKDDADFICFMDSEEETINGWTILPDNKCDIKDPRRRSRWYKFHSHELFDGPSLWLDGRIKPTVPIKDIFDKLEEYDIVQTKHPHRDCIYDEADICIEHKYADKSTTTQQVAKYRADGFPRHFGLNQNGIILRKNNNIVKEWNNSIWGEYMDWCQRDQVCSQYVTWKLGIEIGEMPRDWFYLGGHKIDNREVIS